MDEHLVLHNKGMPAAAQLPLSMLVVVFMSMATTLLAPPLLKLAFRGVSPAGKVDEEIVRVG